MVDDDTDTCMSISKMLRSIELEADWTTSGKEAVLRAKEAYEQSRAFKVYIIDWLMPDMNGIENGTPYPPRDRQRGSDHYPDGL
ncbi:MAG: hypothetical protein ACLUD2_14180 [Clostridium sp.]